jgi:hypothetical protein
MWIDKPVKQVKLRLKRPPTPKLTQVDLMSEPRSPNSASQGDKLGYKDHLFDTGGVRDITKRYSDKSDDRDFGIRFDKGSAALRAIVSERPILGSHPGG